jgi:hypothetical protein
MLVKHGSQERRVRVTGTWNTGFCGIAGNMRVLVGRGLGPSSGSTRATGSSATDIDAFGGIAPVVAGCSTCGNAIQPKTVAPNPVSSTHAFHH